MSQLNQMQRYAISLYLKEKKTQAYIAEQLNKCFIYLCNHELRFGLESI